MALPVNGDVMKRSVVPLTRARARGKRPYPGACWWQELELTGVVAVYGVNSKVNILAGA